MLDRHCFGQDTCQPCYIQSFYRTSCRQAWCGKDSHHTCRRRRCCRRCCNSAIEVAMRASKLADTDVADRADAEGVALFPIGLAVANFTTDEGAHQATHAGATHWPCVALRTPLSKIPNPLGVCLPPACHVAEVLKPPHSTYPGCISPFVECMHHAYNNRLPLASIYRAFCIHEDALSFCIGFFFLFQR
ncbi:hypothetical protein L7F22_022383 [Adiantum nelumboides]|nr:hypothetical protein [Adiantum nelumboides]